MDGLHRRLFLVHTLFCPNAVSSYSIVLLPGNRLVWLCWPDLTLLLWSLATLLVDMTCYLTDFFLLWSLATLLVDMTCYLTDFFLLWSLATLLVDVTCYLTDFFVFVFSSSFYLISFFLFLFSFFLFLFFFLYTGYPTLSFLIKWFCVCIFSFGESFNCCWSCY